MDIVEELDTKEEKKKQFWPKKKNQNKERSKIDWNRFRYKNLNIKARLLLAFSMILFCLSGMIFYNLVSFQRINDDVSNMVEEDIVLMKNYDNVNYYTARRLAAVRGYLLTNQTSYLNIVDEYTVLLNEETEKIINHVNSPETLETFTKLAELDTYLDELVIGNMEKGNRSMAMGNMNTTYNPQIEEVMDAISSLSLEQSNLTGKVSTDLIANIRDITLTMFILLIIVVIVGIAFAIVFANSFTKPIVSVMKRLKSISTGLLNEDPLVVKGSDEISRLMQSTNDMQERLIDIMTKIKTGAEELAQQSEELSQSSNEVKAGSEQVAITMQELSIGTENQAHAASQLASNMDSFVEGFSNTSQSSEKVTLSSKEVLDLSGKGKGLMTSSSQQMEKINRIVQDAVVKMDQLDKGTKEINKLVVIIRSVADQTNLLALNAAIEAARAGEHGRGFSVVADEVRKLSEQVAVSVKEITGFVENIQAESRGVTQSLSKGAMEAKTGMESITETTITFDHISASLQSMVANIDEINANLTNLNKTGLEMGSSISEIASVSEESAAGVEQTSAASQEISSTMEEVAVNSSQIAQLAELLNSMVSTFQLR